MERSTSNNRIANRRMYLLGERKGNMGNPIYFHRNQIIQKTDCGKGWYIYNENRLTHPIYKTIDDAKNSIDMEYGSRTCIIAKRLNKPIKIIGKMTFKLDEHDNGYYEYEWF